MRYRLQLDTTGVGGIREPGKLLILRRPDSTAAWTPLATRYADSGALITNDTLSAFGEFTIGADAAMNPLPVEEEGTTATFALHAPYPNPARQQATLRYALPRPVRVVLAVYDVLGRRVATLTDETKPAGRYRVRFAARDLPAGAYVVRLRAGRRTATRTLTVVR